MNLCFRERWECLSPVYNLSLYEGRAALAAEEGESRGVDPPLWGFFEALAHER